MSPVRPSAYVESEAPMAALPTITGRETIMPPITTKVHLAPLPEPQGLMALLKRKKRKPIPIDTLVSNFWYGIMARYRTYPWDTFMDMAALGNLDALETKTVYLDSECIPSLEALETLCKLVYPQGFTISLVRVQNSMGDLEIISNEKEKHHEKELKPEER